MKPLGMYASISSNHEQPLGLDDDYDWYVRHAASQRAASTPARRMPAAAVTGRLLALARLLRPRSGAPTARRI